MTFDESRECALDELEALAAAEAKAGDGRALRHVKRLRAQMQKQKQAPARVDPARNVYGTPEYIENGSAYSVGTERWSRPMHEDNGA